MAQPHHHAYLPVNPVLPPPPPLRPNLRTVALTVAAIAAPIALIGGWFAAATVQPAGYSSTSATISELAATTAHDRWIMTAGFAITGCCLVVIAVLLSAARPAGRATLVLAGVGVLGVSAAPLPGHSGLHTLLAWLSFAALAVWPVLAMNVHSKAVRLRPPPAIAATAVNVLLILLDGPLGSAGADGLAERLLAGVEILWVAAVVLGKGGRT